MSPVPVSEVLELGRGTHPSLRSPTLHPPAGTPTSSRALSVSPRYEVRVLVCTSMHTSMYEYTYIRVLYARVAQGPLARPSNCVSTRANRRRRSASPGPSAGDCFVLLPTAVRATRRQATRAQAGERRSKSRNARGVGNWLLVPLAGTVCKTHASPWLGELPVWSWQVGNDATLSLLVERRRTRPERSPSLVVACDGITTLH